MRRDHPSADSLIPYATSLLEDIRSFCITSKFIDVPSEVRCIVRPTPSFAAERSFASLALVATVVLSGCTTLGPVYQPESAPPADKATIYVYRDFNVFGGAVSYVDAGGKLATRRGYRDERLASLPAP